MKFVDAKSVVEIIGTMRLAVRAELELAQPPLGYNRGGVSVRVNLPFQLNEVLPGLGETIEKRATKAAHEEAELSLQGRIRDLAAGLKIFGIEFGEPELKAMREEVRAERLEQMGGATKAA